MFHCPPPGPDWNQGGGTTLNSPAGPQPAAPSCRRSAPTAARRQPHLMRWGTPGSAGHGTPEQPTALLRNVLAHIRW